jgi:hypothetical protein
LEDFYDFYHATAALPYCNVFLTERFLGTLLTRPPLDLSGVFGTIVVWDESEAVDLLRKKFAHATAKFASREAAEGRVADARPSKSAQASDNPQPRVKRFCHGDFTAPRLNPPRKRKDSPMHSARTHSAATAKVAPPRGRW